MIKCPKAVVNNELRPIENSIFSSEKTSNRQISNSPVKIGPRLAQN